MTTDPTPESEDWLTEKCRDPEFVKAVLEEQRVMAVDDLRSAIADETERCAGIDPLLIACGFCHAKIGLPCWDEVNKHPSAGIHYTRFAAAIRARGEK